MDELEAEVAEIIENFRRDALMEYRYALSRENIEMTGELRDSFESVIHADAANFIWECEVSFVDYGRYTDMKGLNTGDKMAPLEAMMYFVEKTGPEKFLNQIWAKRYGKRSGTALIRNIAWGVRIARFRQIEHRRKGRGWYSKSSGKLFAITGERIRQAAALAAIRHVKNMLEQS